MEEFNQYVTVTSRTGLHMRPVAVLVKMAQSFDAIVSIHKDDKTALGHSVVEMLMLGIIHGDALRVSTIGNDAEEALKAIVDYLEKYTGDSSPIDEEMKSFAA